MNPSQITSIGHHHERVQVAVAGVFAIGALGSSDLKRFGFVLHGEIYLIL